MVAVPPDVPGTISSIVSTPGIVNRGGPVSLHSLLTYNFLFIVSLVTPQFFINIMSQPIQFSVFILAFTSVSLDSDSCNIFTFLLCSYFFQGPDFFLIIHSIVPSPWFYHLYLFTSLALFSKTNAFLVYVVLIPILIIAEQDISTPMSYLFLFSTFVSMFNKIDMSCAMSSC